MATAASSSNKAKIARRVIEVLEYFDDNHREATVMDIVRRYNRPQSSTSELLSSLVDLGLLYKDPYSRSYCLTPRAALLGSSGQAGPVRDGRLVQLVDRLVAQTGLSVAVYGMVGLNTQIISLRSGTRGMTPSTRNLFGGMQEPLGFSAAGWLLLSTIAPARIDGVVRRLIAEAPEDRRFSFADMSATLKVCRDQGHIHGQVGFGANAETVAALLPDDGTGHRLAVGFVFGAESRVQPEALRECLTDAIRQCMSDEPQAGAVEMLQTAA